ncbi:MAG: 3'(2'),5'-bisphosphate nucleotidase CysQ [Gammaproteobacteria bacterium]|nr:3'(2'),5'-bisphosphate nucleotidase CysQ [Gammaproteobacteria bacterium]
MEALGLMNAARTIARQAGKLILEVYQRADLGIVEKADTSPLTEADLAAHRHICQALARLAPELPVLSEESAALPRETRAAWRRYWLVDPLDGTKEFIERNGEFTVNIALIEDGVARIGVVYAPALDVMYSAALGLGAFMQDGEDACRRIAVRPVPLAGGLPRYTVVASRRSGLDKLEPLLAKLGQYELTNIGSALKICLVAEGKADLYPRLGLTSEWDTAAAQCVLEEAGGTLCDESYHPLRYNGKDSLLNPYFLAFGGSAEDLARLLGP